MEPYKYTYPEEEQKTPPRKDNRQLFTGLFLGLLLGSVVGYILGAKDIARPGGLDLFSSPISIMMINGILVFVLLIVVLVKRSILQQSVSLGGDSTARMKIILMLLVLGLVMAGFIAFYLVARLPQ